MKQYSVKILKITGDNDLIKFSEETIIIVDELRIVKDSIVVYESNEIVAIYPSRYTIIKKIK